MPSDSVGPSVAALIGSDLRALDRFLPRLDALLVQHDGTPSAFDAFISTDARSLACARRHRLLERPYVRWVGESPDTAEAIRLALGPLPTGVSAHHLHQWWRLADAWAHMEKHERRRAGSYEWVVRLRSDLRLPAPLELAPPSAAVLRGAAAERALVMRGDWIFWGRREAVRRALTYVHALPQYHRAGQSRYLELPYRHMVAVGADALSAGLLSWLKFPRKSAAVPGGFPPDAIGSARSVVEHARRHLAWLEGFHQSGAAARLPASEAISARDRWWRWNGIPDNEKFFFLHVLNASLVPVRATHPPEANCMLVDTQPCVDVPVRAPRTVHSSRCLACTVRRWHRCAARGVQVPVNMMDLFNRGQPRGARGVTFLHKETGLLIPEGIRHHPNCTCVCSAYQ